MTITTVFDPPLPTDSAATFNSKAFDTISKLNDWTDEANSTADDVNDDATAAAASQADALASKLAAAASESSAASSAIDAATSAGAIAWVSGTTYAIGDKRWSPANLRTYRRRTVGAGTTDPSLDPTNWAPATDDLQLTPSTASSTNALIGQRVALRGALAQVVYSPASPQAGDRWAIKVANGRTDGTINWNGSKHEGLSDATSTLERPGLSAEFVYIDATYGWGII